MSNNTAPLLYLVGPTAAGKTAAALMLAQYFPLEIISMDSALVYRGMDIGTAKPSLAEQAQVPHHLLDIRDPSEAYSAATFAQDAQNLIQAIRARNKRPLIVGGTLLYYKALSEGLHCLPSADSTVRQQLDEEAAQYGWPAMHARLKKVDPSSAARLSPNDAQRIQRALEIWMLSGKTMTQLLEEKKTTPLESFHTLALEPQQRETLHQRIAARFDAMMEQGFLDEVHALRARGDLHHDLPAMRCVGYRQAWQYLDGAIDRATMRDQSLAATRQLAKRQLTWLRSLPARHTIACDQTHYLEEVLRVAQHYW